MIIAMRHEGGVRNAELLLLEASDIMTSSAGSAYIRTTPAGCAEQCHGCRHHCGRPACLVEAHTSHLTLSPMVTLSYTFTMMARGRVRHWNALVTWSHKALTQNKPVVLVASSSADDDDENVNDDEECAVVRHETTSVHDAFTSHHEEQQQHESTLTPLDLAANTRKNGANDVSVVSTLSPEEAADVNDVTGRVPASRESNTDNTTQETSDGADMAVSNRANETVVSTTINEEDVAEAAVTVVPSNNNWSAVVEEEPPSEEHDSSSSRKGLSFCWSRWGLVAILLVGLMAVTVSVTVVLIVTKKNDSSSPPQQQVDQRPTTTNNITADDGYLQEIRSIPYLHLYGPIPMLHSCVRRNSWHTQMPTNAFQSIHLDWSNAMQYWYYTFPMVESVGPWIPQNTSVIGSWWNAMPIRNL